MSEIQIQSWHLQNELPITTLPPLQKDFIKHTFKLETNEDNHITSPDYKFCPNIQPQQYCSYCRLQSDNNEVINYVGYNTGVVENECHCGTTFRKVCVVFNGDWEWIARILGLSGPNGFYFCPFCHVTLDDIRPGIPHSPLVFPKYEHLVASSGIEVDFSARHLEELHANNSAFIQSGKSKDHVKDYQNCEFPPLFNGRGPIIDLISTMSLHVELGMGKLLLDFFEEKAIELDREVRLYKGNTDYVQKEQLEKEKNILQKIDSAEENIKNLEDAIDTINASANEVIEENPEFHQKDETHTFLNKTREAIDQRKKVQEIRAEIKPLTDQLKELKMVKRESKIELKKLMEEMESVMGPFQQKLRKVLDDLKLQRQVYHSGALVGNDIKKNIKADVVKKLIAGFKPIKVSSINGGLALFSSHSFRQKLLVFHKKLKAIFDIMKITRALCRHEISPLDVIVLVIGFLLISVIFTSYVNFTSW